MDYWEISPLDYWGFSPLDYWVFSPLDYWGFSPVGLLGIPLWTMGISPWDYWYFPLEPRCDAAGSVRPGGPQLRKNGSVLVNGCTDELKARWHAATEHLHR